MSEEKLLSIIVLNWNRLRYSERTISEIIKQTTVPNEIILVDNNSAEPGLREYLSSIKGNEHTRRVELVFNNKNLGVAGGRNSGLVKARGEYLFNIDDDVLVPKQYDKQLISVCDNIPNLGITGINVEPFKYPVKIINEVRCRPKNGNLGGAALCIPRRIFNIVGFYNYGFGAGGNLYGHEDYMYHIRLKKIGLISAYIEGQARHLDKDEDREYRKAKNAAHVKRSIQLQSVSKYVQELNRTGNVYVGFDPNYDPPDSKVFTNDLILGGRK